MHQSTRILIKGGGDLASGVALRLHRCGFSVIISELAQPLAVRRTVAFAQAVFDGLCTVEELRGRRCTVAEVDAALAAGEVPVLVTPSAADISALQPTVTVDAIMAKRNTGTQRTDSVLVVALGPGFRAGADCHAVVETNRGHALGRVIWQGCAEPNTGEPGDLPGAGVRGSRVLRASADGHLHPQAAIGDRVAAGATLAMLRGDDQSETPLLAPFAGVVRGLIHPSVHVTAGMKIGDLDPRAEVAYCFTVSDKSLAIAGGVLEAILVWLYRKSHL